MGRHLVESAPPNTTETLPLAFINLIEGQALFPLQLPPVALILFTSLKPLSP